MSRIVCNSGPLIALGILARLDILKSLFDEVLVSEAVQKEIEQGGIKLSGLEDFRRANWIQIVPLKEQPDELLESLLDVGEAAVISLAREQRATLVLIGCFSGCVWGGGGTRCGGSRFRAGGCGVKILVSGWREGRPGPERR